MLSQPDLAEGEDGYEAQQAAINAAVNLLFAFSDTVHDSNADFLINEGFSVIAFSQAQTIGTGTFTGEMIASIAFNPMLDTDATFPTYLQWMQGNHTTSVNFANMSVSSEFTGTVFGPSLDA